MEKDICKGNFLFSLRQMKPTRIGREQPNNKHSNHKHLNHKQLQKTGDEPSRKRREQPNIKLQNHPSLGGSNQTRQKQSQKQKK